MCVRERGCTVYEFLKLHNLLLDNNKGILKIIDLELGRAFTVSLKKYMHKIAILWYKVPEVLLGSTPYSIGVDMWSVGCIFGSLVSTLTLILSLISYEFNFMCFQLVSLMDRISIRFMNV